MDQSEPARRRRTTAIIAAAGLACLAIAIPVSGAFADGNGNGDGTAPAQNYGPGPYGQQGQQRAPNRQGAPHGNCPKKDQQGGAPSNGGQRNNESGTALPGDTVAS